jgi:hypothetical protein
MLAQLLKVVAYRPLFIQTLQQHGSGIEHSSSAFRRRQSVPVTPAASPAAASAAAVAAAPAAAAAPVAAAAVVPDESTALRDRLLAALVAVPPSTQQQQQQQQQFLSESGLGDYCISGDNSLSSSAAVDILKCEGVYSEHDAAAATADAGYELDVVSSDIFCVCVCVALSFTCAIVCVCYLYDGLLAKAAV